MCDCNSTPKQTPGCSCGCQGNPCFSSTLWSKKKQIQYVKNSIDCLKSQAKDLQDKLDELEKTK